MGSRLLGLDALRGIAALIVVLFHAGLYPAGDLAVDLFFAISGFVMARTYESRMADGLGVCQFYRIRFARLWPVFAIGVILGGAQFLSVGADPFRTLVSVGALLLFLPSPTPIGRHQFNPNGPGWSLFLEIVANVIHAAILGRASTRTLCFVWIACAAIFAASTIHFGYRITGSQSWMLPFSLSRCLTSYIAGIIIYRSGFVMAIRGQVALIALPLLVLFGGIMPGVWFGLVFVIAIAPVLVASATDPGFRMPLAGALGAMSYPLYATHMPVLNALPGGAGILACVLTAWIAMMAEAQVRRISSRNQTSCAVGPRLLDQP